MRVHANEPLESPFGWSTASDVLRGGKKKRLKEDGAEGSGSLLLGLLFQLTPPRGDTALPTDLVLPVNPGSPTGWLLLRQFPLCPGNETSLIYWFAIFQMTSYTFPCPPPFFPLLSSLLLNSHLSHFHFPVLWNSNNTFQLPSAAVRISCLLTPSPRHH